MLFLWNTYWAILYDTKTNYQRKAMLYSTDPKENLATRKQCVISGGFFRYRELPETG